jgi:TolB-like protein
MQELTQEVRDAMAKAAPLDWAKCGELAERFGCKPRQIQAAATRGGVQYVKQGRVSKSGKAVVSKVDLVAEIAKATGLDVEVLDGLDKATKTALEALVASFE